MKSSVSSCCDAVVSLFVHKVTAAEGGRGWLSLEIMPVNVAFVTHCKCPVVTVELYSLNV